MSSGVAIRPSGTVAATAARACSSPWCAAVSSVRTSPAVTQLTRTAGAHSIASAWVSATSPALAAA